MARRSRLIIRWSGSTPARAGSPSDAGKVTTIFCWPLRIQCFARCSAFPNRPSSDAFANTPTSTRSCIGTSVSLPTLSARIFFAVAVSVTSH
jgi:hypothetical protein